MKRVISIIMVLLMMTAILCSCSSTETTDTKQTDNSKGTAASSVADSEKTELIVFAAASMTETLGEIKDLYEKANPSITLTYTFDSSGTLKTQIEEGAECDLFISAANKQMDQLDIAAGEEKNPEKLDFIDSATRVDLLENKVTLAVPDDNSKNIDSFDTLAKMLSGDNEILMAMGNEDVPVGQYTQKILEYYGLSEKELADSGRITYGSNVKEVTSQVKEGSVNCGVIYSTDARSADLRTVDTATEEMCGKVIYPAAVLKNSKNSDAAKAFLDYLQGDEAGQIFSKVGFTPVQ